LRSPSTRFFGIYFERSVDLDAVTGLEYALRPHPAPEYAQIRILKCRLRQKPLVTTSLDGGGYGRAHRHL